MALQVRRASSHKVRLISTLIAVFALVIQPYAWIATDEVAHAAATVVVNADNANGWTKYGTAQTEYVGDSTAPLNQGALKISDTGDKYVMYYRDAATPIPVENINISYDSKRIAGAMHAAPAFVLGIDTNEDMLDDLYAWYEPAYNGGSDYNNWRTWILDQSAKFYFTDVHGNDIIIHGKAQYAATLQDVKAVYPAAKVIDYTINQGTGNAGWVTHVDNVVTPEAIYDFDPVAPTTPVGLKYTTPAVSCSGATNSMNATASWDTVANAVSYNYKSWAPHAASYNTEDTAYPVTTTTNSLAVSFVLGEGTYLYRVQAVDSQGVKSDWSAVCSLEYDNTIPEVPTSGEPRNKDIKTNDFYFTWSDKSDSGTVVQYEFRSSRNLSQVGSAQDNSGAWKSGILSSPTIHSTGAADGKWYWQARSLDAAGNKSAWSQVWNVTIDTNAPAQAQNLELAGDDGSISNNGVTESNAVTVTWSNVSGAAKYEYCYWNDILTSTYRETNCYTTFPTNTSQSGTFTEGEGVHHIKVRAIDAAGNEGLWSETFNVFYLAHNSVVNGENFNTHNNTDYKGINVGFNIDYFKTVENVAVSLYRDGESTPFVTNTSNQKLLELIASGTKQLSTPFITAPGTYVEEYWNLGTHAWTANDKPARAVVTVTGINSADERVTLDDTLRSLSEPDGVTSESILPVPADNNQSGNEPSRDATSGGDSGASNGTLTALGIISPLVTAANSATPTSSLVGSLGTAGSSSGSTENGEILGSQTKKQSAKTPVVEATDSGWNILGLAWYWWILLIAAIAAIWWLIAHRRNAEQN